MEFKLSQGAVATLMKGNEVDKPVFQILGFKKIAGQGGNDRYRLNISDGLHTHTFAMLATQLNNMILSGDLDNHCIIRAEKLINNHVGEKRVLIILELTILANGGKIGKKIGNPVAFTPEQQQQQPSSRQGQTSIRTSAPPAEPTIKSEFPSKSASSFYGQPKPAATNGNSMSSAAASLSDQGCVPIRDITPYNSKVTIKARVTGKTPIKTWSNARGEGKLFSIDLLDDSGEIKMTGFNTAVDQYYDTIKINEVYIISKFSTKTANKQFNSLNHDYEIQFTPESQVMPCMDDDSDMPTLSFNFTEIAFIENLEKDRIIDVVGVCKSRGELGSVVARKDGREIKKREILLVDRTKTEVLLTLWGKQAEDFEDDTNPVIAIKGARVGDFNGKNLSVQQSSTMMINPDIKEAHILRGWYDNEGMNVEARSLVAQRGGGASANAPWKMIYEATASDPASAEAGYFFKCRTTVVAIKRDNALYKACPEERCNKKVVDCGNGLYRCEKCNKDCDTFKWRLMLQVHFGDVSGSLWASCFQEHAETILDGKADELGSLFENEQDQFDAVIKHAAFKSYTTKFRAKLETYNNENRIKYTVMEMNRLNFAEYAQKLIAEIKETTG